MARLALIKSRLRNLIRRLQNEGKPPKEISAEVAKYLKANASSFKRIGRNSFVEVKKEFTVYQNIIAGNSANPVVRQAAAAGLRAIDNQLAATGSRESEKLTNLIQKALEDGTNTSVIVSKINKEFENNTAVNTAIVRTAKKGFNRLHAVQQALDAGVTQFEWAGPSGAQHSLCKKHLHKVFTIEEIKAMRNSQLDPVLSYMGGYNCRHHWEPVID